MNSDMMRRMALRDMARGRGRGRDRNDYADMNYGGDSRRGGRRGDSHYGPWPMTPQMYSNEYGMGRQYSDNNSRNRYTPAGFDSRERDYEYGDSAYTQSDSARGGRRNDRNMEYDGHYEYPFEVMGRFAREPIYSMYPDFGAGEKKLSNRELKEWAMRLLHEVDEKDRSALTKESILKKAEELGIRFDKFSEEEFYVTVLMMFTDYASTLGTASIDVYLKLAKDWLCDDDIAIRYGEKLAAYYDTIVEGA